MFSVLFLTTVNLSADVLQRRHVSKPFNLVGFWNQKNNKKLQKEKNAAGTLTN